ncbi:DUF6610 family protein [Halorarum salinum]|nr:DUF6610 family protein [Halobaculum salinum]
MREDKTLQQSSWANVAAPVGFLDNDFRDPDLDRYLERVDRYHPDVAVVGDATTYDEAERYQQAANNIRDIYSEVEPVIVPKCRDALEAIEQDTVIGWPNGYANIDPLDYSSIRDWRGRRVHILGGSPTDQYDIVQLLTQPTLTNDDPADIIGLDGNGVLKAAYFGEYWTPTGYERADHLSIRDTVRRSLEEMKEFWEGHGIWPDEEPIDRYGPAVKEPDEPIWMDDGGDPLVSRGDLEAAYIGEYEQGTMAFQSEAAKKYIEFHEGWR